MSTTKPQAVTDVLFAEDAALFTARRDINGALALTVSPAATGLPIHIRIERGVAVVTIAYDGDETEDCDRARPSLDI